MTEQLDLKGRDALESLLPFYLNGTLEGAELARVESWLADDPAALISLAEAEAELSATNVANEAHRPPADALKRFTASLEAETAPAPAVAAGSFFADLWEKFIGAPPAVAWGAAAAMLALVVAQAVTPTGNAPGTSGGSFTEAGIERAASEAPHVLVVFAPDAGMAEISALLDETGASLAGGPKPGGIYRVELPATTIAEFDEIADAIAASPLTGQVLPGRKPGG